MARKSQDTAQAPDDAILNNLAHIRRRINALTIMAKESYVRDLLASAKYDDPRRLERSGFKVYSQYDEDGVLQEIFTRIGAETKTFVEFGVGNGLENNTLKLLLEGWRGLWMEGDDKCVAEIMIKFKDAISSGRLFLKHAFLDRDNINSCIGEYFVGDIDLLSIDIDGNDIHVLDAVSVVKPRVVVIEYNAKFPPAISIAQKYNPSHRWSGTDYFGASLAAITKIAKRKGYSLVCCGIAGVNAFFVRDELLQGKFQPPFTAENYYQPARYFLNQTFHSGHAADWGPYEFL